MMAKRLKTQLFKENTKPITVTRLTSLYDSMFEALPKNNSIECMVNNIMSELGSTNHIVVRAASTEFNSFIKAH